MLSCYLGIIFILFSAYGLFVDFHPTNILAGMVASAFLFGTFFYEHKEKKEDKSFKEELEKDLSQYSNRQQRLEYWEEIFRKNPPMWSPINDINFQKERDRHKRRYKIIVEMLKDKK